LVTGAVLEIFAKKEGWYEKSRYECKVSVIEGEVVTSMGIETVVVNEENCKRARRMVSEVGKDERVKDKKSDAS
jgi:hypothetical protein